MTQRKPHTLVRDLEDLGALSAEVHALIERDAVRAGVRTRILKPGRALQLSLTQIRLVTLVERAQTERGVPAKTTLYRYALDARMAAEEVMRLHDAARKHRAVKVLGMRVDPLDERANVVLTFSDGDRVFIGFRPDGDGTGWDWHDVEGRSRLLGDFTSDLPEATATDMEKRDAIEAVFNDVFPEGHPDYFGLGLAEE